MSSLKSMLQHSRLSRKDSENVLPGNMSLSQWGTGALSCPGFVSPPSWADLPSTGEMT